VIPFVVGSSRIYGKVFNKFETEGDGEAKLHHYIHNREPGQALITVCNHTSVVDEPVLFSCMLRPSTVLRPHMVRVAHSEAHQCPSPMTTGQLLLYLMN
jgi:hypothetical protein